MQLFGLVNNLLAQNHEIAKTHLSIERYVQPSLYSPVNTHIIFVAMRLFR